LRGASFLDFGPDYRENAKISENAKRFVFRAFAMKH
jgi:hypothetical protein